MLAEETSLGGGVKSYEMIDASGLYFLASSTPTSGPGEGWPPEALHWGHKTCTNLRNENP